MGRRCRSSAIAKLGRVDHAVFKQPLGIGLPAGADCPVRAQVLVHEGDAAAVRKLICDHLTERPMRKADSLASPGWRRILADDPFVELAALSSFPILSVIEPMPQLCG